MKGRKTLSLAGAVIVLAFLVVGMVVPSLASAQGINLGGIGINLPSLPQLPILSGNQQPAQTSTGTTSGYGGYANGYNAGATLPSTLGNADVGLSSGEVNSQGGIVPDWAGTPQNEATATSAGIVEAAGADLLNDPNRISVGSAGSTSPPPSGILGSAINLPIPVLGNIQVATFRTQSGQVFTQNQMTVVNVSVDALGLNLAIPVGNSTANVSRSGNLVESQSTSGLVGTPGQPVVVGAGLINGHDAVDLQLLEATSTSRADGTAASNYNTWKLTGLAVAGQPVVVIDSSNGAQVAGATLIPAPAGGTFLALDQLGSLAGIWIGETWSNSDGKTYAYGGVNNIRVALLGQSDFLILGHAGSGANAVSANGPGSGPNQTNEGPPGSNIPPGEVSPPNTVPIVTPPTEQIGPPPTTTTTTVTTEVPQQPGMPGAPVFTPLQPGAGIGLISQIAAQALPNTGVSASIWMISLLALAAIGFTVWQRRRAAMLNAKV